jgi:hypothetical protein
VSKVFQHRRRVREDERIIVDDQHGEPTNRRDLRRGLSRRGRRLIDSLRRCERQPDLGRRAFALAAPQGKPTA